MTKTNRSDEHTILEIKSLKTYFFPENGTVRAVDGVDLKLDRNTTLGLVGESGCGKSVTALSVMRLIQAPPGKVVEGEILFYYNGGRHGVDIARLDPRGAQMRNIRGGEIAMVFQEPMTSLNPLYTVGAQIAESVGLHQNVGHKEALDRALEMLYKVRIGDPEQPRASPPGLRIPPAMPLRQRGLQPGRATPGRDRARTLRQLPLRRRVESTRDWRLNMSKPRRTLAFLAYLLPVLGWLYVLLFHKKDEFAAYHAKQSMMITIAAIGAPVIWGAVAWILTWLPLAGPIIAAAAFALVVLAHILLAATWIIGMVYASQAKMKPVPVIGGWAERILAG